MFFDGTNVNSDLPLGWPFLFGLAWFLYTHNIMIIIIIIYVNIFI